MKPNSFTVRSILTRAAFAALSLVVCGTSLGAAPAPTPTPTPAPALVKWHSDGVMTDTWSDSTYWTRGSTPMTVPLTGDTLDFTIVSGHNLTLTDDVMTPATFTINGITLEPSGFFTLSPAVSGTNGFTLTTGITNVGSRAQTINDIIALSGQNIFTMSSGGGLNLKGVVSGSGSLIKEGPGVLSLSATNTYTGATTVNAGTLSVTGSLPAASAVTVAGVNGAILGGTGAIKGSTVVDGLGTLLGGTGGASGTLTLAGLTMEDNSDIELTLGAGDTHSSLARSGGVWSFDADQTFTFLGTITPGTYDNVITGLTGTEAGLSTISTWVITDPGFKGTFSLDSSHNVDVVVTAVPEPSAFLMMFAGLGSFLACQRIRRRA